MKSTVLTNEFHNTRTRVMLGVVTPERVARIRKRLCGMDGCRCAENGLGTRGKQDATIVQVAGGAYEIREQLT